MNYKDTLFFVGNCLTLRHYPQRIPEIRKILQSGELEWEHLVLVSSQQLVLPALYIQLRDSKLLNELPADLIVHLDHLHETNSRRNKEILAQISDIIKLLNSKGISPIFLKGTAHMMDGLYRDHGERMIGDIDFLVAWEELLPAVELLGELGYYYPIPFSTDILKEIKHYPRLRNDTLLAAVEVHRQPVSKPYDRKFNFDLIDTEKRKLIHEGEAFILSDRHQIIHNMMNAQMNDKAFKERKLSLRHSYDLFLLSQRANCLQTSKDFGHYFKRLNAHIIVSHELLDRPDSLQYENNSQARRYLRQILFFINHPAWHSAFRIALYFGTRLKRYVTLPVIAIYNKAERKALIRRLGDKSWYKAHFATYKNLFIRR